MSDIRTDSMGTKRYFLDNKLHNTLGPALVYHDLAKIAAGDQYYFFLNGVGLPFEVWLIRTKKTPKEKTMLRLKYPLVHPNYR